VYPPPDPPFYFWLAVLPLYGAPLYVIFWAVRTFAVGGERGKAMKGLAAVWRHGCADDRILRSRLPTRAVPRKLQPVRTPEGNARAFALILLYTVLAVVIVLRLHRYGKLSQVSASGK